MKSLGLLAALVSLSAWILLSLPLHAQLYQWSTLAGPDGGMGANDGTGRAAAFNRPRSLAVDSAGGVYVADYSNHLIRKITADGVVTTLAGSPGVSGSSNGTGRAANFNQPSGVALDASGNIYVADSGNHLIRRITPDGVVSTFAGAAGVLGSANGPGTAARFNEPAGLAVDVAGNVYVADCTNHLIRKITPGGEVTTFAGRTGTKGSTNGTGTSARFNEPAGVAVDASGNVYVADSGNHLIRKITAGGVVTTFAGMAGASGSTDGTGGTARFNSPMGLALDGFGNVYVDDTDNHLVRKITTGGEVSTLAGTAGASGSTEATGSLARFSSPAGVAVDDSGNLYIADFNNNVIRKITLGGEVSTFAGTASLIGSTDGTGSAARFNYLAGVAVDGAGTLYAADSSNDQIRKITRAGVVSTLAGSAGNDGSADGTGSDARFSAPYGAAVDGLGNVYVADTANQIIRKITPGGEVSTVAGTAGTIGSTDGIGSAATFSYPNGVAVDGSGHLYVADTGNYLIRKITPGGEVSTLAGTAGFIGSTDGTGSDARFSFPYGVAVDGVGNVYVSDTFNSVIRKITPDRVVTTLAGTAGSTGSADGTGSAARFNGPGGLAVDGSGNVYVADFSNHLIRKITPGGEVRTIGGTIGNFGWKNGTGSAALFYNPFGIAVDSAGTVYVTGNNNNLRMGVPIVAPSLTTQPLALTITSGFSALFRVTATGTAPLSYQWRKDGADIVGANAAEYTLPEVSEADAASYDVVVTNLGGTSTSQAARLSVRSSVSVSVLTGSYGTSLFKGSRSFQRVEVVAVANPAVTASSYALMAASGSEPAVATGTVPADGQLSVPLRSVTASGQYIVRVTRTYASGYSESIDSIPFFIRLNTWADAAGTFALMLEDGNGLIGDGAHYRGKVTVTITSTGAFSGRLSYNEAPRLQAAGAAPSPDWSLRSYAPVTRTFASAFNAGADGNPQALRFPGAGMAASNNQVITLNVDFSATPLRLVVSVKDYASVPTSSVSPDGAMSSGSASATLSSLSSVTLLGGTSQVVNLSGAAATRYAIAAKSATSGFAGAGSDNNGFLLVQALPSGGVLWASRLSGYTASGSGLLRLRDPADGSGLSLALYEAQSTSGATTLNTTSLLGEVVLQRDSETGSWGVRVQNGAFLGSLERQNCYLAKGLVNGKPVPLYSAAAFTLSSWPPAKSFNWSGVGSVDFGVRSATAWNAAGGVLAALPSLKARSRFVSAEDPLSRKKYVWRVSVSATGAVNAVKHIPGTAEQPALSMALDQTRGEFWGGYTGADGLRRTLRGVVLPEGGSLSSSAQGWLESGVLPGLATGGWWLGQ